MAYNGTLLASDQGKATVVMAPTATLVGYTAWGSEYTAVPTSAQQPYQLYSLHLMQ